MLGGSLDGREIGKRMDTCVCIAGSLCGPSGAITTWLIKAILHHRIKLKKQVVIDILRNEFFP